MKYKVGDVVTIKSNITEEATGIEKNTNSLSH